MHGPILLDLRTARDFLAMAQFNLVAPNFCHPIKIWHPEIFAGLAAGVDELRAEVAVLIAKSVPS